MNKRLITVARICLKGICAMLLLGGLQACKDDYKWDDTTPGYLNSSIYDYLQSSGNYTNYVKLIDDLDYAEVLSKTGSKTLFVADDDAFATFYSDNAWGVRSYDQLTTSQKKLLLYSSMLNNAYLLEMMSSTEGPNAGQCLRRETSSTVLDSVPHFNGDELPVTYNETDKDYWERFRQPGKGGIYMALDNTSPMMTHYLATQMKERKITDEDFAIIMGIEREKNDAYIYDCKVVEGDIVCQNGYINRLDKVLITPQNMAEVIRTNGKTKIFSHMLDRFSAPFYNAALTSSYRLLYGNDVDSVFEKRYFNTQTYRPLKSDANTDPIGNPNGNTVSYGLTYDPGWNQYRSNDKLTKEQDMGVMFVPTDQKLYEYFFSEGGGGRFLIEAYAPEQLNNVKGETDYENMYRALDQVPLSVIQALLNNLMKEQFTNSVPSKFETIKDDAQDPMLDETDLQYIEDVLQANNGVIFLMDEIVGHMREGIELPKASDLVINKRKMSYHDGANKRCYYVPEGEYVPAMKPFGQGERYNITGLAHDVSGFPTNDNAVAGALYTRLMEKIDRNRDDIIRVQEYLLEDADTAVVCFGGTTRSVMTAVQEARAAGGKVGMFRPVTVWPFPEERLQSHLSHLKKILMVEHNYGQMLLEVQRAVAGQVPVAFLGQVNGTVIPPKDITAKLTEMEA